MGLKDEGTLPAELLPFTIYIPINELLIFSLCSFALHVIVMIIMRTSKKQQMAVMVQLILDPKVPLGIHHSLSKTLGLMCL